MLQRAALAAGEDRRIHFLGDIFIIGEDHAPTRTAQRLVRGGGGHMGMRERRGVFARGHQPGEMRHVDVQPGADAVGDLAHAGEIDLARDGRAAGDDHLGLVFLGQRLDLVVVQRVVLLAHAILDGVEPLAGLVRLGTVGQVAAGVQAHAEDGVAGLDQRLEDTLVGLAARIRLHIGEGAVKELFGAVDGQVLGHIDPLAAAIVAASGVSFGVFVGHDGALGLHHGGRDDVFRRDQLNLVALAAQLGGDRGKQFGVAGREGLGEKTVVAMGGVHGAAPLDSDCGVSYRKPALTQSR